MSDFALQAIEIHHTLDRAVKFIERQPDDCMGRDPAIGYFYRDEWLTRAKRALEQLAEEAQ